MQPLQMRLCRTVQNVSESSTQSVLESFLLPSKRLFVELFLIESKPASFFPDINL